MKQGTFIVGAMVLALSVVAVNAGRSLGQNSRLPKSTEIRSYPKASDYGADSSGVQAEIRQDNGERTRPRIEDQKTPNSGSSPGGALGRYSSPVKKPVTNPDMGYQR